MKRCGDIGLREGLTRGFRLNFCIHTAWSRILSPTVTF